MKRYPVMFYIGTVKDFREQLKKQREAWEKMEKDPLVISSPIIIKK